MRRTVSSRLVLALVTALILAACGGGEGEATTLPGSDTSAPTTAPPSGDTTTTVGSDQGGPPELAGSYMVTRYFSSEFNGATNLWPDTEITIVFGADGTISGNAGCNDYTATYEVSGPYVYEPDFDEEDGQAMTISDLSWTEMPCEDELTMEQEAEYLEALQNVEQWWVGHSFGDDENALHLLSLENGLQVQASLDG
jgi:hypothetical protein